VHLGIQVSGHDFRFRMPFTLISVRVIPPVNY